MKNKLRLMGAKKFLHMPKGTYYIRHWEDSEEDCLKIIETFKTNPEKLLYWPELDVYGDNGYSMSFWDEYETFEKTNNIEDIMFVVDTNVIGDAGPKTTLYLVLDETWLPDEIVDMQGQGDYFKRKDIIRAHDEFIKDSESLDNVNNPNNKWAWDKLTKDDQYKDSWVINYDSEDE